MDIPESQYLSELWVANICPWCGKNIPEGTRVGSGQKSEGGFCSLACYANYHSAELEEKAQRVSQFAKQQLDSQRD